MDEPDFYEDPDTGLATPTHAPTGHTREFLNLSLGQPMLRIPLGPGVAPRPGIPDLRSWVSHLQQRPPGAA